MTFIGNLGLEAFFLPERQKLTRVCCDLIEKAAEKLTQI